MRAVAATLVTLLATAAPALASDFEHPASQDTSQQVATGSVQRQDTPADPDYDGAEPDTVNGRSSTNLYDEQFGLFGFPSALTPLATYKEGPHAGEPMIAGFNAAGAWKRERGRPDVAVAILDTGVRWDRAGLRDQVRLNRKELPRPRDARGRTHRRAGLGGYDLNGDGALDVDDYANDPRVKRVTPPKQKLVTGEDLIHAFSDHRDQDHNGYVDDIAGWDFFDDDNDPADASSYFAAANHGSGRAAEAVERGNDKSGGIGVCPHCQFVPLRVWDTFVADSTNFGLAVAYATDIGVKVIEGADGALYHSAFMEQASQYAYRHGVAQAYSGNDLNTGDHNYPANYDHTMEIQGVTTDSVGLGTSNELGFGIPVGTQVPVLTFFRGANTTQFGGHSSVSMNGTTGSQNTGQAAGAAALVISAARDAGVELRPDETREILEQTAEDITPGNTAGLGIAERTQDGWDEHFGYGRVDLGKAVSLAASRRIPPEAAIDSPEWYAPLTGATADVTGTARARFADGRRFHWTLEWGPGLAPTSWRTVDEGEASGTVKAFGTLDLDKVRETLAAFTVPLDPGGPTFSTVSPNPFQQQFTVRLRVTGAGIPTVGEDRQVLSAIADPTLLPGYPKRMGTGGEAPLRYADLDGDGVQELVLPLEDGTLHAFEPNGKELRGWPVHTRVVNQARRHLAARGLRGIVAAPLEALRAPLIADLDGDGEVEVITAAGRRIYAWEADGSRRAGFPVSIDPAFCRSQDEKQPLHHRKCGFLASPSLARLDGRGRPPAIVAPALDGHVYAFRADGSEQPHFPVDLVDPGMPADKRMYAESINEAAIGDLNGDGRDDVVASSNESYGVSNSTEDLNGLFAQGVSDILANALGGSTRVYAIDGATGKFLPGWPVKVNGAIQDTLPLVGPGHDPALVKVGGTQIVVASATGGALAEYSTSGHLVRDAQQNLRGPLSDLTDPLPAVVNFFESATVGDVMGTGSPALVKWAFTAGGLVNLAAAGQNVPYNHTIGAYDAASGLPLPAWPRVTDDFQFLSGSNIAKIAPGASNQVVAGTGLGLLHAYDGVTGRDVAGFPKVTSGWLYSPAALSDDGRIAAITREGWLFQWTSGHPACQSEWPAYRHDQYGTGNYDADGTPPGAPRDLALRRVSGRVFHVSFSSPGDDGYCGTAKALRARAGGKPVDLGTAAPGAPGTPVELDVTLPRRARALGIGAVDDAGNYGPFARVRVPKP